MTELKSRPWDRRLAETRQAYEAFRVYLGLGDDRSILQAAHNLGKSRQIVGRWSSEHDWVDRCSAHDAHLGAVEMKARERVRAELAEKWEKRRVDTLEKKWGKLERLAAKLEKMIDQMQDPNKPLPATMKNLGNAMRLLVDEYRAKMTVISDARGGEPDDFDPATATPDELRAYLASKGVKTEGVA